ncbi:CerR family C-terminal domain-containing protein [Roseimaritima ulvae]|uniref:Putative DNA-binding transcriptional regulator n=1 Tax=Roseimaritima ulvae TaxID=980254 RepID=A0A5B9QM00_9BACT|nr:CerR family C-terminal domain-containing protein [Roseimaritima ulvae]QEG38842.1 putative DNA-binding transcriptional regulator [Roseimaritima ulvae]
MSHAASRADDPRLRILDAAGPTFAKHGFDNATVREICAAAGVNVASVAYYFGDKMGLYLEVIRLIRGRREQEFPMPAQEGSAEQRLYLQIHTLLQRMLAGDAQGWEAQLMMREMQRPTEAFREMAEEYFRPLQEQLETTIGEILQSEAPAQLVPVHQLQQLALSVVGQCLYYRVGGDVVQQLVSPRDREQHYTTPSLARHITAVMLASLTGGTYFDCLHRSTASPTHE